MGICASCLGLTRRDSHDQSESSRLLDDDIYQTGYGYGALNQPNQLNQPDQENLKRERDALDAICQRTSDSVVDIWSLHPQPHLQPNATLHSSTSSIHPDKYNNPVTITTPPPPSSERPPSSTHSSNKPIGTVPKHWGEVVINPQRGKPSSSHRPEKGNENESGANVFGVLNVA